MNYLWAGMILIGIVYGILTGHTSEITNAALESAKKAVELSITMLGVMGFWVGIMKIAEGGGLIQSLGKKLNGILRFLFPGLEGEKKAKEYIATNMIANIFGLGWAATPAGLKAMEEMAKMTKGKKATNEMCTFLIINISSLQLIPVNMIAYRSQYQSIEPTSVIGPGIVATSISTIVAIIFCKIMCRIEKEKE